MYFQNVQNIVIVCLISTIITFSSCNKEKVFDEDEITDLNPIDTTDLIDFPDWSNCVLFKYPFNVKLKEKKHEIKGVMDFEQFLEKYDKSEFQIIYPMYIREGDKITPIYSPETLEQTFYDCVGYEWEHESDFDNDFSIGIPINQFREIESTEFSRIISEKTCFEMLFPIQGRLESGQALSFFTMEQFLTFATNNIESDLDAITRNLGALVVMNNTGDTINLNTTSSLSNIITECSSSQAVNFNCLKFEFPISMFVNKNKFTFENIDKLQTFLSSGWLTYESLEWEFPFYIFTDFDNTRHKVVDVDQIEELIKKCQ